MADTPTPEEISRLYLDFWQRQIGGLTRDPQVAESIARVFDLMTAGANTFAKMMAGERAGAEDPHATARNSANATKATTEARLDQIARRLAELERRIAGLEPRARVRRARAPTRSRRPRRPG